MAAEVGRGVCTCAGESIQGAGRASSVSHRARRMARASNRTKDPSVGETSEPRWRQHEMTRRILSEGA
jgi:hypothetical protein